MRTQIRTLIDSAPAPVRRAYESARGKAMRLKHIGGKFKCPCCHSSVREFLPLGEDFAVLRDKKVIGGGWRENGVCPLCLAIDRERLTIAYLEANKERLPHGGSVLHIAPEPRLGAYIRKRADMLYVTGDYAPKNVTVRLDLQRICFDENAFDLIVCSHVLEHVGDDRAAMRELRRVLKPGGCAILQVPLALALDETFEDASITAPAAREQAYGQWDHVRLYGRDYAKRLETAGFAVDALNWRTNPEAFCGSPSRYGLDPNEDLYIAARPTGPSAQ